MRHHRRPRSIADYIAASTTARDELQKKRPETLTAMDIQNALCEHYGITDPNPSALLEKKLNARDIIKLLNEFDFGKYHPEKLTEIYFSEGETIIPEGTIARLDEKQIAVKGEVWTVHKNDVDPWPSSPHAHNYDAGLKLQLGTGELFSSSTRKPAGKITSKNLAMLRSKLTSAGFTLP